MYLNCQINVVNVQRKMNVIIRKWSIGLFRTMRAIFRSKCKSATSKRNNAMVNKLLESKLKGSEPVDTASEGKVNDSDEQTTMDGKNMPDMSDQPQATPFANA